MSELGDRDYMGGFNTKPMINKQIAHLEQDSSVQVVAATSTGDFLAQAAFRGEVADLYIVLEDLPGTGESLAIDVYKNGVSILTAPVTVNAALATEKVLNLYKYIDPVLRFCVAGDVFTCDRTYTAGTPTPIGVNTIVLEPSKGSIRLG